MTSSPPPAPDPGFVALRLVTTYADAGRRIDLRVDGSSTTVVEDGVAQRIDTVDLWPTVRELLPPLEHLRTDPAGPVTGPRQRPPVPGEGFAGECLALVTIATLAQTGREASPTPVIRAWLATADELWSAQPRPDGSSDLRPAHPGALADTVIWDLTGAMERLVTELEQVAP